MQYLLVLLALLIAPSAVAQDGEQFVNDAMGFEVRLPEGFSSSYADTEMTILTSADGTQEILLIGANSFDPLERLAERHMGYDEQEGWTVTPDVSTPTWVTYGGSRNGMQLRVRMIEICPRWQFARLAVSYPDRDAVVIQPLLEQLTTSFKATGTATCE